MLLRKGTLRLNVGPCAQESQRGVQVESVLGLTRSYTQLLEKEISGQEKKKKGAEKKRGGR